MCDNHNHESWITPECSKHLTAKMVVLPPGHGMAEHTTGPGREEVLIVLQGTIQLVVEGDVRELYFGDTAFIPVRTRHSITNHSNEQAGYCFVVTKKGVS